MRKHFPGCRNARLRAVAPLLGVRETRRIVGDFRYTVQDVVERRAVSDTSASPPMGGTCRTRSNPAISR